MPHPEPAPDPALDLRIESTSSRLGPGTVDAVHALARAAEETDGVAPLSEQPLLTLAGATGSEVVHLLAYEGASGGPVGYAQLDLRPLGTASVELVVAPRARRRGIGATLLTTAGALAREVTPPRDLAVWAHGDLPAARALAASAGLVPVRELWQLRLELPDTPPDEPSPALPPGVAVRPFVPGEDEDAWLRLNARAFAHHPEQGAMTRADLDARENEPWFDPAGLLLAERGGELLAALWTKVHAHTPAQQPGAQVEVGAQPAAQVGAPVGEIYVLGVDPAAQGLGLGTALTRLGLDHLRSTGVRTVVLYTEADNLAALRTYTRAGFVRSGVDVMFGSRPARARTSGTMGS